MDGFRTDPGTASGAIILHVPHASMTVPADVRANILLSDAELAAELAHLTDAHTDLIAERAAASAGRRPWLFVNRLSRLVIDPERFPDEREDMAAVGMGAVYTRTSDGRPLRTGEDAAALLERCYHPYARAMTDLVDARLAAVGRVTIIDVHSYPSVRLPYERGGPERPAVCLGTDPFHTPDWLLAAARNAFAGHASLALDTPFAGCYVPLRHYQSDPDVSALMIELRRDTYLTEPGGAPTAGLDLAASCLADLIDRVDR